MQMNLLLVIVLENIELNMHLVMTFQKQTAFLFQQKEYLGM